MGSGKDAKLLFRPQHRLVRPGLGTAAKLRGQAMLLRWHKMTMMKIQTPRLAQLLVLHMSYIELHFFCTFPLLFGKRHVRSSQSVFVEDLVINVNHCNLATEQKLDLPFGWHETNPAIQGWCEASVASVSPETWWSWHPGIPEILRFWGGKAHSAWKDKEERSWRAGWTSRSGATHHKSTYHSHSKGLQAWNISKTLEINALREKSFEFFWCFLHFWLCDWERMSGLSRLVAAMAGMLWLLCPLVWKSAWFAWPWCFR